MKKFLSLMLAALMLLSAFGTLSFAEDDFKLTAVDGTAGNSGEGLDKLFDGNTASKYCTMNNTAYVIMALSEAKAVNTYAMTSAGDAEQRDPKDWIFSGSNDCVDWTTLDEKADEDFPQRNWENKYYFENTTAYRYYKLEITANNGKDGFGLDILQLAEFAVSIEEPEVDDRIIVDTETITGTEGLASLTTLFDGDYSTKYITNNTEMYVTFALKNAKAVNSYTLVSGNDCPERDPKAWILLGSTDGSAWTTLDSQSDVDFPQRNWEMTFYFDNTTEYLWYKLYVTEFHARDPYGVDRIQIAELTLAIAEQPEEDPRVIVDTTTISAPAGASSSQGADKLFDGSISTKYCVNSKNPTVVFALTTAKAINSYTLSTCGDAPARNPKTWNLYGSTDGSAWVLLDAHTDELFPGYNQTTGYTFDNDVKYTWFKFEIVSNSGDGYTQISELALAVLAEAQPKVIKQNDFSVVDSTAPNSGSQTISNAFDCNAQTKYLTASSTAFITVSYTAPVIVNRVVIVNANDHSERFPASFTVSGSNDGENFVEVGKITGASADAYYKAYTFDFDNTTAYSYYKLDVLSVASGSYMHMADLGFYTVVPVGGFKTGLADEAELSGEYYEVPGVNAKGEKVTTLGKALTGSVDTLFVPASVVNYEGAFEDLTVMALIVKNTNLSAASIAAIADTGAVVYVNKRADGTDTTAEDLAKAGVTVRNPLEVYDDAFVEGNTVTSFLMINTDDLYYNSLTLKLTFSVGGEAVKTFTQDFTSVCTTLKDYATTNVEVSVANDLLYVDGCYLAGLSINNVPAGTYELTAEVFGVTLDENGEEVTVVGDAAEPVTVVVG